MGLCSLGEIKFNSEGSKDGNPWIENYNRKHHG